MTLHGKIHIFSHIPPLEVRKIIDSRVPANGRGYGYFDPKNMGKPPKSSILIGFSLINHPFWGTPIFGNTHMWSFPKGTPSIFGSKFALKFSRTWMEIVLEVIGCSESEHRWLMIDGCCFLNRLSMIYHESSIMYHLSPIMYEISCMIYLSSCIMYHLSCIIYHLSIIYHISSIINYLSSVIYHISSIIYHHHGKSLQFT